MLTADRKHKMRMAVKSVIRRLSEAGKLDFEYTGPNGEADVSDLLFKTLFKGKGPAELATQVAKVQGVGIENAIATVADLLKRHHCSDFKVHLPKSLEAQYVTFSEQKLTLETYHSPTEAKLAQGDLIVLVREDIPNYITETRIAELNDMQVSVMVTADSLLLPKGVPSELESVSAVLNLGLSDITTPLSRLHSFFFAIDDSAILAIEGLKCSHLYIRFEEPGYASDYEAALSYFNRLTISTPTKLGADILRVLLTDKEQSELFVQSMR